LALAVSPPPGYPLDRGEGPALLLHLQEHLLLCVHQNTIGGGPWI
jgi:hypothetical protein